MMCRTSSRLSPKEKRCGWEIFLGKININQLLDWASRSKNLSHAVDIPDELLIHLLEDPVSL